MHFRLTDLCRTCIFMKRYQILHFKHYGTVFRMTCKWDAVVLRCFVPYLPESVEGNACLCKDIHEVILKFQKWQPSSVFWDKLHTIWEFPVFFYTLRTTAENNQPSPLQGAAAKLFKLHILLQLMYIMTPQNFNLYSTNYSP
jgi:hypothetical protein